MERCAIVLGVGEHPAPVQHVHHEPRRPGGGRSPAEKRAAEQDRARVHDLGEVVERDRLAPHGAGQAVEQVGQAHRVEARRPGRQRPEHVGQSNLRPMAGDASAGAGQTVRVQVQQHETPGTRTEAAAVQVVARADADVQMVGARQVVVEALHARGPAAPEHGQVEAVHDGVVDPQERPGVDRGAGPAVRRIGHRGHPRRGRRCGAPAGRGQRGGACVVGSAPGGGASMSHARWLVASPCSSPSVSARRCCCARMGAPSVPWTRRHEGRRTPTPTRRSTDVPRRRSGTRGTASVAPEAPAPEDLAAGDVLLRGRVVGPDGRPAFGATIEVAHEETVIARGAADAEGALRDPPGRRPHRGHLAGAPLRRGRRSARGGPARPWGPHPSMPSRIHAATGPVVEVGVVRLLGTLALDVEVRFPTGATPPATVHAGATGHGPSLALGAQRTDDQGRLRLESLPEGTVRVLAIAEGSGRWSGFVTFPREEDGPLVIDLPVERLVTVEVVDATTQAPIAGAVLTATECVQAPGTSFMSSADWWPPLDPARTDAAGHLVLRGLPPDGRVRLSANAEGYPHVPPGGAQFGTARIEADTTDVHIDLPPPRTVRWPIEDGPVPRPAEGADVTIRPAPGTYLADVQIPTEGRIEAGELVVGGWPPGPLHGHAVAPDGGIARLFAKADTDTGNPITFFPARKVEARLRYPDGEPAAGFFVNLRNQGNNPVASSDPTDAQGRAVIEDLYGGSYSLLQVPPRRTAGRGAACSSAR